MNDDMHEQAHGYAVGALSADEAAAFERHLEGCAACRSEVAGLHDVTVALSDGVAVEPPPGVRTAVLAAISRAPQESGGPGPARQVQAAGGRFVKAPDVVPIRRSRAVLASSLVAAAAVLAALAFGGIALQNHDDAQDASAQTALVTQLLSAKDVRTVPGESGRPGSSGTIVLSKSEGVAVLVSSGLPDTPSDKVYEAWTIDSAENAVPAGTFTPGGSHALVRLPTASLTAKTVAVTVEPDGGSDQPTGDPVITFSIPAS
jgi:anti-sigma-K factor RskA